MNSKRVEFLTQLAAIELSIEEEMIEKINLLGEENSFAYLDLRLTHQEFELIDQLRYRGKK